MKIINCLQGSPEWKQARAGRVTASRVSDVLAKTKSGEAAARRNYRAQLVAEILTGLPQDDGYVSAAMQFGTDHEPFARTAYELARSESVEQVGFVVHPVIDRSGASPDGLVGEDGLVELKVPNTATHIDYLLACTVPAGYQAQMLWQMACTGRAWCDFVSYDPRLPEHLQLFIARLERDEERILAMEMEVFKFLGEVDGILECLPKAIAQEVVA